MFRILAKKAPLAVRGEYEKNSSMPQNRRSKRFLRAVTVAAITGTGLVGLQQAHALNIGNENQGTYSCQFEYKGALTECDLEFDSTGDRPAYRYCKQMAMNNYYACLRSGQYPS